MAGILTPPSTGDAPAPPPARPAPAPIPSAAGGNTLGMNSPLAGTSAPTAGAAPPIHSNQAINEALMSAFHPIIPDQVNSLLGPAIGALQGRVPPIAFYQPRQAQKV